MYGGKMQKEKKKQLTHCKAQGEGYHQHKHP
jgi:hypothetical protein